MTSAFWHPGFVFSVWIYHEFCVLANRASTANLYWVLRSGTPDARFHWETIMNSALWHPIVACSLRIYNEFCVLAPKILFPLRVYNEFCSLASQILLSLRINNEFCVLAPQIRVSISFYNEFCILAHQILISLRINILHSGKTHFWCESVMNSVFWHPRFVFSLGIYNEFYILATHNRVFPVNL